MKFNKQMLIFFILVSLVIENSFAQNKQYDFYFSDTNPGCNPVKDRSELFPNWKVSHGTPQLEKNNQNFYEYLKLGGNWSKNSTYGKSEGVFTNYNFLANHKYTITLGIKGSTATSTKNAISIEINAVNGLKEKTNTKCNFDNIPKPSSIKLIRNINNIVGDPLPGKIRTYTKSFVPGSPYSQLWLLAKPLSQFDGISYINVDYIYIVDNGINKPTGSGPSRSRPNPFTTIDNSQYYQTYDPKIPYSKDFLSTYNGYWVYVRKYWRKQCFAKIKTSHGSPEKTEANFTIGNPPGMIGLRYGMKNSSNPFKAKYRRSDGIYLNYRITTGSNEKRVFELSFWRFDKSPYSGFKPSQELHKTLHVCLTYGLVPKPGNTKDGCVKYKRKKEVWNSKNTFGRAWKKTTIKFTVGPNENFDKIWIYPRNDTWKKGSSKTMSTRFYLANISIREIKDNVLETKDNESKIKILNKDLLQPTLNKEELPTNDYDEEPMKEPNSENVDITPIIIHPATKEEPYETELLVEAIKIFPNPACDIVNIVCNKEKYNLSFYNMVGQKVIYTNITYNNQIDISHLTKGCYTVIIDKEGEILYSDKLIKK